MEQVLTVTILDYFRKIHNAEIISSNGIELLNKLKEFEQIHLANKVDFSGFRGLNFESILEVVQQDIHRIEQSHNLYKSKGNLITGNTKQGSIEQKNKEYIQMIDENKIGDRLYAKVMDKAKDKKPKKSIKQQAEEDVNSTILKRRIGKR